MRSDWCSTDTWKHHLRNRWDNENQEKVNILPREAHHFNPEYFPEGLSLRHMDQSRAHRVFGWQGCTPQQELKQQTEEIYGDLTNTFQGQCWYSGFASYSQSRRGTHVAHTACCTCKCFKGFMSCDDEILDALAVPGNDNDLPSIHVCSWKALFVCCIDQKSTQK